MNKNNIKNIIILVLVLVIFFMISFKVPDKGFRVIETKKIEKINRNFFPEKIELKNYSGVRFNISDEGKKIIDNARNLHSIPTFISGENRDKELCAGYIWILSEKFWGKESPYYIGMQNKKEGKPAKAWELPNYYKYFGGKVLIDFTGKFDLEKKDVYYKISDDDLKKFFSIAFSEEALFGDIGFLYKDTAYTTFLKNWYHNSHIAKNLGVSKFEFTLNKDYKNDNYLEIIKDILGCEPNIDKKLLKIFENYKFKLNEKYIVLKDSKFYYLEDSNLSSSLKKGIEGLLGEEVQFKYLDKFEYSDVIIADFFEGVGKVHSLLQFSCEGNFYPVNISSINPRLVEKY